MIRPVEDWGAPQAKFVTRYDLVRYGPDAFFDAYVLTGAPQYNFAPIERVRASSVVRVAKCHGVNLFEPHNHPCHDKLRIPSGTYGVMLVSKFDVVDWAMSLPSSTAIANLPDNTYIRAGLGVPQKAHIGYEPIMWETRKAGGTSHYIGPHTYQGSYDSRKRFVCLSKACAVLGSADYYSLQGVLPFFPATGTGHYPWLVGSPLSQIRGPQRAFFVIVNTQSAFNETEVPFMLIAPHMAPYIAGRLMGGATLSNVTGSRSFIAHPVERLSRVRAFTNGVNANISIKLYNEGGVVEEKSWQSTTSVEYYTKEAGLVDITIDCGTNQCSMYVQIDV